MDNMDTETMTVSAPCSIQKGPFICGGCGATMYSICILYAHMTETHSDGSFHYDNMIKTAFPKHDSCCINTQTEAKYMLYMKRYRYSYKERPPHRLDGQDVEAEVMGNRIYLTSVEGVLKREQRKKETPQLNRFPQKRQMPNTKLQTKKHTLLNQSHDVHSNKLRRSTRITQSYLQNCVVKLDPTDVVKTETKLQTYPTMTECPDAPAVIKLQGSPKHDQSFEEQLPCVEVNGEHAIIKTEPVLTYQDDSYSKIDDDDTWDDSSTYPAADNCTDKASITEDLPQSNTVLHPPITEANAPSGHDDNGICTNDVGAMNESENALATTIVKNSGSKKQNKKLEDERRPRGRPRGPGYRSKKEHGSVGRPRAKKFVCHICGQEVKSNNETIESHMNEHMGLKPYICDICALPFHTEYKLARHQLRHEALVRTSKFKCDECGKHLPCKMEYLAHINKHSGSRPYKCDQCDGTFATSKYRRQHIYRVHTKWSLNCKICGKIYGKLSSLNNHISSAHTEPTFQCRFCDRRFSARGTWKNHEWTHSGSKQYFCSVCRHGFIQWTPFLAHMTKQHGFSKESVVELKKLKRNANVPTSTDSRQIPVPQVVPDVSSKAHQSG